MIHREKLPLPSSLKPMAASPGRPPEYDLDDTDRRDSFGPDLLRF
jgi:hypothetical protein